MEILLEVDEKIWLKNCSKNCFIMQDIEGFVSMGSMGSGLHWLSQWRDKFLQQVMNTSTGGP